MSSETELTQLQEKNKKLQARVRRLSEEKANLYLTHHLMEMLIVGEDIESMLKNLMVGIGECVGGTDVEIYYWEEENLHYANLHGIRTVLNKIEDPLIIDIFEHQQFIEKDSPVKNTKLISTATSIAWDWIIPLTINERIIGAIKVSNMLGSAQMRSYLAPFFQHLALLLNNQLQTKAAKVANKAKGEFLAVMSHEIRTPMNAMLGMMELMLTPELTNSERHKYVTIALKSGNALLVLLNDILDFSKMEAGKLSLDLTHFRPQQFIQELCLLFQQSIENKGLELKSTCFIENNKVYMADHNRLQQMLSNLINNAIKFTEQGFIYISISEISHYHNKVVLEFSVQDSGIGIPEGKRTKLFKPFSQVDSSTTRYYGGTGLGLSIVEQLSHLMQGKVGCESIVEEGSRFWFQVTVEEASSAPSNSIKINLSEPLEQQDKPPLKGVHYSLQQQQVIKQLLQELDQLLINNMFSATSHFKKLEQLLSESTVTKELRVLAELINAMSFEEAHAYLQKQMIEEKLEKEFKQNE